ncbi:hypothetical protein COCVIDRAFT_115920 [Bipolaris victoriae FI3]|uniref:Uncharacterized protein n=1 Tax=Bipolaris victoriae (strain FI3) TaxID=930091 RepID=W7E3Y9_BIPV3|nr:hypothetical protein COCVIDRAFT_115920 [Bipolaris victoriae FI3]
MALSWRDGTLRDLAPRWLLPSDVDVHRPSAIALLIKERILLITCNISVESTRLLNSGAFHARPNRVVSRIK